ncbi:hypothetical protein AG1IA_07730 [Rhizoctonia solani AG-1 IA]|uniref:Uncharacterized protein n=1 Tax=Thanatephorus cucumeris (strain AG1-IA) TaxID=983506 RepID=L8WJ47_THACA|nr:hypothetical protein AG1IA_07730 [Rhizoctonia solani AG-1 IA]
MAKQLVQKYDRGDSLVSNTRFAIFAGLYMRIQPVLALLLDQVASTGWETYVRSQPRPSISLTQHLDAISPLRRARYIHLTDRAWASRNSIVRPLALSHYSIKDASPCLVATPSMLIIAVANALHVYSFLNEGDVRWRGHVALHRDSAHDDITAAGYYGYDYHQTTNR